MSDKCDSWLHGSEVCLSLLLLVSGSAWATDYYIAPDGSDVTGDGSFGTPYETITKAQDMASSGDTVYLRGGTYALETTDITYSYSAWDSVNHITKDGISYLAYSNEVPVFDFSAVQPVGRRVTAFLVEADNCVFEDFEVVGVQVTIDDVHTQSECFRIVGGNNNRFERLSMHDGMGIGWYLTRGGGNRVINCDAYNNKGLNGYSHGNIDGFGAHTDRDYNTGNQFIGCRAWFNSDDGFDLINNDAAVVISNCWAMFNGYDYESPSSKIGDSTGFKAGGYGISGGSFPTPVPRNRIYYCLAVGNNRGFYANHHTGGIDWVGNTAISNGQNFNMMNNLDATSGNDVPGFDHYMKNNLGFGGGAEVSNLGSTNDNDVTYNYWTLPVSVTAADFKSLVYPLLTQSRQSDGSLPMVEYARLAIGSDCIDAGTSNVNMEVSYTGRAPDLGAFESTGYEAWIGDYPGVGTNTAMLIDPDEDGVSNLGEYGRGGDPSDENDRGQDPDYFIANDLGSDWFYYVYPRRVGADDLIYHLNRATDLGIGDWTNAYFQVVGTGVWSGISGFLAVTNRVPLAAGSQQFLRLHFEYD